MNVLPLIIIVGAVLFASCSAPETPPSENTHLVENVSLNEGNKWDVPSEMVAILKQMLLIVNQKKKSEIPAQLKQQLDELFNSCSMRGEAHEQLHNYLIPLIEKINALKETPTASELHWIKHYLEAFNTYFKPQ